jgi:hypothetical protein
MKTGKTNRAGALLRAKKELEEIIEELEELTVQEKEVEERPRIPIQWILDALGNGSDDITNIIGQLTDVLDSPLPDPAKISKIRKILS